MNPRERALAIILGALVILLGGGVLGYRFFYAPWDKAQKTLAKLKKDVADKQQQLDQAAVDRRELKVYREQSLPSDLALANREYVKYLYDLFSRHDLTPGQKCFVTSHKESGNPHAKKEAFTAFTRLSFQVLAYTSLDNLVAVMDEFYRTGLLHEIKSISIKSQTTNQARGDLVVNLTIEALVVEGGGQRTWMFPNVHPRYMALDLACNLQRGPSGLALALWAVGPTGPLGPNVLARPSRSYAAIAGKNIFFGRQTLVASTDKVKPQWLVPRLNYLTDLTCHDLRIEGSLYDRANNLRVRLASTSDGNTFSFIRDTEGCTVVEGTVIQLEERLVRYRIGLHVEATASNNRAGAAGFFPADSSECITLLADKVITGADMGRVLQVNQAYWDSLVKFQVIQLNRDRFTITIERDKDHPAQGDDPSSRLELLRGRVLRKKGGYLFVQVEERYHTWRVGENLEESLAKALSEEEVKELKLAVRGN
jgi:RNase P/RNase MRP subunit p29